MTISSADISFKPTHTSHGQEQQRLLVQESIHVIAAGGFEHFRTREVARRVGVNIATLHYYFPTKEDLIREVMVYIRDQFRYFRDPTVSEPTPQHPRESLYQEFRDLLYQMERIPEIFIVLMELSIRAVRDPYIRELIRQMNQGWHQHLEEVMTEGVRQGVF